MTRFATAISLALSFSLLSCSQAEQPRQLNQIDNKAGQHEAISHIEPNKPVLNPAISIVNATGATLAELTADDDQINIDGNAVRTKIGSNGKQKYLDQSGNVIAKIKRSDKQKFKLKTDSGDLLWKIKRKADSIKIANNEQMSPALKIKDKGAARAKIISVNEAGIENELVQVRMESGKTNVELNNQMLTISAPTASIAAVLSLESIPLAHRLIIVAELRR